jgi:hypothetical protein
VAAVRLPNQQELICEGHAYEAPMTPPSKTLLADWNASGLLRVVFDSVAAELEITGVALRQRKSGMRSKLSRSLSNPGARRSDQAA